MNSCDKSGKAWMQVKGPLKWVVIGLIVLDIYCLSAFILVKPCNSLGRFPFNVETLSSPKDGQPVYAGTTYVCVLDNKYNAVAYYVYWPLHRTLENRGYWYFVKDPQSEMERKW